MSRIQVISTQFLSPPQSTPMSLTDYLGGASDPFLRNDCKNSLLPASRYANKSINPYEMFPYIQGQSQGIFLGRRVIPKPNKRTRHYHVSPLSFLNITNNFDQVVSFEYWIKF